MAVRLSPFHEFEDLGWVGSQTHTEADLGSPLANHPRDHAINSRADEQPVIAANTPIRSTPARLCAIDRSPYRLHLRDGDVRVGRARESSRADDSA
jgi:hypothetical protein